MEKENNFPLIPIVDAEKKKEAGNSRRSFLKKTVWAAPTLVVLGGLMKPQEVRADFSGDPAGPPGGWNP